MSQYCGIKPYTQTENFFIITNLIHKLLVHSHKLHEIKFLYIFRAQSAHHQEINEVNIKICIAKQAKQIFQYKKIKRR